MSAKKESAAPKAPGSAAEAVSSATDSKISIAELLDLVNKYFPDVLPQNVPAHYGRDSRPNGSLSDGVRYSSRPMVFDGRSYRGSYDSYGGEAYRRSSKRDAMGRYAREGYSREGTWETVNKIEDLIREAPDEQTRQELQKIAGRMRNG